MAARHRHSVPPAPSAEYEAATRDILQTSLIGFCYAKGVPEEVADRVVYRVLRVAEDVIREERGEPGAVADQRDSSPLG